MWNNQLLVRTLSIAILTLPLVSTTFNAGAIAETTFGQLGQDGSRGKDGRNGRDGQDTKIILDGKPAVYNLTGIMGDDAQDGKTGRSASMCEQPYRPEYSLVGASGGRGGDGGNGGRGGNGGNATVFYTDATALQQLEIRNSGGKGGRNGRSALGGKGCECQETEWRIKYCDWEITRRPFNDDKAEWQSYSKDTKLCYRSGDDYDRQSSRVSEYRRDDWLYRRTYKGVSRSDYYSCRRGLDGENGNDGRDGEMGSYGKITLVPRLDIPAEVISDRTPLADAIGKKVGLIKNIWVERNGLTKLLRASSDVSDRYTYLKDTARLFYRFDWAAPETPKTLGIDRVEIGAIANVRNEAAEIQYQLPGTLEYQVLPANSADNLQVVKITGGFAPDRVKSFQVQSVSGVGNDNQLILSDRGNVRELLKDTQIEVQCFSKQSATGVVANDYVKRRSITFKIPPKLQPSDGAIVNGNTYTLPVGRYCSPWLKADYNVGYGIVINQITKSGTKYDQSIDKSFVVGKN